MTDLLTARSLLWASYDPPQLLTALLKSLLHARLLERKIQAHLAPVDSPKDLLNTTSLNDVGLVFWNLHQSEDLPKICRSIQAIRNRVGCPLNLVYCRGDQSEHVSVLCESGAQIVVTQVTSLQSAIDRCLLRLIDSGSTHLRLSESGYHPLVAGLVDRLPWPHLD